MEYRVATPELNALDVFKEAVRARVSANPDLRMLEAGTLRWRDDRPTHHRNLFSHVKHYQMTDIAAGTDVDFTADLHDISAVTGENAYDVFLACSVWEHLKKPWQAAQQVAKLLKPGGIFYVQTHSTFPLHGYPHDYYRFSTEALASLFDGPCNILRVEYEYPATIASRQDPRTVDHPSFLNVNIVGEKKPDAEAAMFLEYTPLETLRGVVKDLQKKVDRLQLIEERFNKDLHGVRKLGRAVSWAGSALRGLMQSPRNAVSAAVSAANGNR
jgi:SAM-dependent methyltransferase